MEPEVACVQDTLLRQTSESLTADFAAVWVWEQAVWVTATAPFSCVQLQRKCLLQELVAGLHYASMHIFPPLCLILPSLPCYRHMAWRP